MDGPITCSSLKLKREEHLLKETSSYTRTNIVNAEELRVLRNGQSSLPAMVKVVSFKTKCRPLRVRHVN